MQQINLYLPEFRPKRIMCSGRQVLVASSSLLVFIALISIIASVRQHRLEAEMVELENRQTIQTEKIEKLKAAGKPTDLSVDQKIKSTRRAISQRQQIKALISAQNLGNAQGFSESLAVLAKHAKPSLAISHFRLSDNGRRLEMAGEVRTAQDLPLYLQALQSEREFSDTDFGLITTAEIDTGRNTQRFSVGFEPVFSYSSELEP